VPSTAAATAGPCVVAAARTPFCRPGGALAAVGAVELALAAAQPLGPADALVLASVLPRPAALAHAVASRLGLRGAVLQIGGGDAAGLQAVAVAARLDAPRVLVIGVESASTAPLHATGVRGVGRDDAGLEDPLAAWVAAPGRAAPAPAQMRAASDAVAARSRARVRAAAPTASVAGVTADEPPDDGRDLVARKPLLHPEGADSAAAVALPADGAAALLLARDGTGPRILATAAGAADALAAAGLGADALAAVELHEGTGAELLAAAAALGRDPERVNRAGGALALGHPVAASGVAMAGRLAAALAGGGHGLAAAPGCALVLG